jgi:hypothetical protein
VLGAALAVALPMLLLTTSAQGSSPCARALGNGVVARLCQSGATKASAGRKVTMRATGYWVRSTRGAVELHGATPIRTGLSVAVKATRIRGATIQLLYARAGNKWLVTFSRLKGRGGLRGKVTSTYRRGKLTVRLHIGRRSIKPRSLRALKTVVTPTPAPIIRHAPRTGQGGGGCALPDQGYDNFFQRDGPGWTGGDGTYSVGLPDGRIAWSFGDSYIGAVSPDGTLPTTTPMVNNSMLIQSGASGSTLVSSGSGRPQSFVSTGESDSWYWPAASTVVGNKLYQFLLKTRRSGSGLWDFSYAGGYVASFSLPGMSLESVTSISASDTVQWGMWVLDDGGYTYIYGVEDRGWDKYVHIARVAAGDVVGQWSYYTGSGWSANPSDSARVFNGVSNQFSVVKVAGAYRLITQKPLGSDIVSYRSDSPVGPFSDKTLLYTTPSWGSDTFTYNALAHPELSGAGGLLISFNVISNNGSEAYSNPEIYRPRFVRAADACFGP